MLEDNFIPRIPFNGFKWLWASKEPTESLNNPLLLLGVLYKAYKLEPCNLKYSSPEFTRELVTLADEVRGRDDISLTIKLDSRTGERNIIRNSKQYWTSLGLFNKNVNGRISLTDFGREIARHNITQAEFAAITILTFTLPNEATMSQSLYQQWTEAGIKIQPLRIILQIINSLYNFSPQEGYLTCEELCNVIMPLSGTIGLGIEDYIHFLLLYRQSDTLFSKWPKLLQGANDKRIAREFLLFLKYYGYLILEDGTNYKARFRYNEMLDAEISELISDSSYLVDKMGLWERMKSKDSFVTDLERKRITSSNTRPNQARFRKEILATYKHCVITEVDMPEVLEAAHIVPFAYNGEDTIANGIPLRTDIHILFDSGNLRISPEGEVFLSDRARMNYGTTIHHKIQLPPQVNKEFLKWRWENYSGL
jgi:hypothetical protein